MSTRISRRVVVPTTVTNLARSTTGCIPPISCVCLNQRRYFMDALMKRWREKRKIAPLLDINSPEYKAKLEKEKREQQEEAEKSMFSGRLAPSSIFQQVRRPVRQAREKEESAQRKAQKLQRLQGIVKPPSAPIQDPQSIKPTGYDPIPHSRVRWERKMVMREVRQRGRLTQSVKISRTEREHGEQSPWIKTSVKKLMFLARQISGKPLHEAMVQMRFSKKKPAAEVLKFLKFTRDKAITVKNMGLQLDHLNDPLPEDNLLGKYDANREGQVVIRDKGGKKRIIHDPSSLYIAQAWVGRGTYGMGVDPRARGRANRLRLPYTQISVILKEEATRLREAKDRVEREQRKKPWAHLPDRPISAQRQYLMW